MPNLCPPPGFEAEVFRKESSAVSEVTSCWHGALVPQPINWELGRSAPALRPSASQGGEVQGIFVPEVSLTTLLLKTILYALVSLPSM